MIDHPAEDLPKNCPAPRLVAVLQQCSREIREATAILSNLTHHDGPIAHLTERVSVMTTELRHLKNGVAKEEDRRQRGDDELRGELRDQALAGGRESGRLHGGFWGGLIGGAVATLLRFLGLPP